MGKLGEVCEIIGFLFESIWWKVCIGLGRLSKVG